jgi:LytS/YehU family sensor histidine kinase
VTDGGPGAAQDAPAQKERLGLGNTRARLEALYGRDQRLELTRAPGHGAHVSLEIPYRAAAAASV